MAIENGADVRVCPSASRYARVCPGAAGCVRECPGMSGYFRTYLDTPAIFRTISEKTCGNRAEIQFPRNPPRNFRAFISKNEGRRTLIFGKIWLRRPSFLANFGPDDPHFWLRRPSFFENCSEIVRKSFGNRAEIAREFNFRAISAQFPHIYFEK